MKKILAVAAALALLSGCAPSSKLADVLKNQSPTKQTVNADGSITTLYAPGEFLQAQKNDLQRDCRKWQAEQAEADRIERQNILAASMKDGVSDTKMGFYAIMESNRATMEYLTARDGQYQQDICKPGTNQWDAYIAEVQETGRTYRQYSSDGASFITTGIKWLGGVYAVTKISENGGDTVGGDKIEAGRNAQSADGDATMTASQETLENHQSGTYDSTQNSDQQKGAATGSDASDTGTDELSGIIEESQASGLTTGETAVKLTEQGYSPTISGGEIYVDGENYGGW